MHSHIVSHQLLSQHQDSACPVHLMPLACKTPSWHGRFKREDPTTEFPLGAEGTGTIAAVGPEVEDLEVKPLPLSGCSAVAGRGPCLPAQRPSLSYAGPHRLGSRVYSHQAAQKSAGCASEYSQ